MTDAFWYLFSVALAIAMSLMFVVWLVARRINNAGIVDIAWSLGFAFVAAAFYFLGVGAPERRLLIAVLVTIWSVRLGAHIWLRVAAHHPEEDGRYAALREQYSNHTWLMFFGFFELQAVLLAILSAPFAIIAGNPASGIQPVEWAGAALWLVAILGEALADHQLAAFRAKPENKGRTCRRGLWRASRHPNYFFEWLVWVAYFVIALGSPDGWITFYCPLLMLFFLLKVTGIPATEAHALKSRGDEYRDYQRTTSVFVPWFPGK